MSLRDLPTLNAALNATSFVLLLAGYALIRRGRREAHRRVMLAAFAMSTLFLLSYLVYHFQVGSVRFQRQGTIRTVYLAILLSHTVLAAFVGVMAPMTLFRGLKARFDAHAKLARITFPIWCYVSFTGVVIYVMLYRLE